MTKDDEKLMESLANSCSAKEVFDMLEDAGMGYLVPKEYRKKELNDFMFKPQKGIDKDGNVFFYPSVPKQENKWTAILIEPRSYLDCMKTCIQMTKDHNYLFDKKQ